MVPVQNGRNYLITIYICLIFLYFSLQLHYRSVWICIVFIFVIAIVIFLVLVSIIVLMSSNETFFPYLFKKQIYKETFIKTDSTGPSGGITRGGKPVGFPYSFDRSFINWICIFSEFHHRL